MKALGVHKRSLSALTCLTLLCADRAAFAQSRPASVPPRRTAPISSSQLAPPAAPTAPISSSQLAPPAAAPALSAASAPAPPEPSRAHGSRMPAFIALGLGGLAAGGAVLSGIFANADYNDAKGSCSPTCSDSELASGRTLALTSTILTGVAVLGVGVGVTLLFTSGPDPAQLGLAPRLRLASAPGAARAEATWSF